MAVWGQCPRGHTDWEVLLLPEFNLRPRVTQVTTLCKFACLTARRFVDACVLSRRSHTIRSHTIKGRSLVLWKVDRRAFEFGPHLLQRAPPRSGRPFDLAPMRSGQSDDHGGVRGVLRGRACLSGRARHVNDADLAVLETHAP